MSSFTKTEQGKKQYQLNLQQIRDATRLTSEYVRLHSDFDILEWQRIHPDFRTTMPQNQWRLTSEQKHTEFPNACMCSLQGCKAD